MKAATQTRSSKNLERFLQDLICIANGPEEVGVLVEVLMALQLPKSNHERTRARVTGA
jgi:hypothetical protein